MNAAMALPGNSSTFLTHVLVRGLEDDRYVVERFQAKADGDSAARSATSRRRRVGAKSNAGSCR